MLMRASRYAAWHASGMTDSVVPKNLYISIDKAI
jgi:hypothetical protein